MRISNQHLMIFNLTYIVKADRIIFSIPWNWFLDLCRSSYVLRGANKYFKLIWHFYSYVISASPPSAYTARPTTFFSSLQYSSVYVLQNLATEGVWGRAITTTENKEVFFINSYSLYLFIFRRRNVNGQLVLFSIMQQLRHLTG
jgi:hypothetical protein